MSERPAPVVGTIFVPSLPPERLRDVAVAADHAGCDELWLWEDCFREGGLTSAAAALAWTPRIRVAIGIVPVPLRVVSLLAMEVATLERMFPDRFVLGVGHGVQDWMAQVGARPRSPLTSLREHLGALRGLLAGDRVTLDGAYVHLDDVALDWPPPRPTALHVGATGPRTLALAGELGDGTVLTGGSRPGDVRRARQVVDAAAARAGRAGPHRLTVFVMAAFGADGRDRLRAEAALWPGLDADDEIGVHGAPPEVAAQLRRWVDAGADAVVLQPTADVTDHEEFAGLVGQGVRPALTGG